MSDDLYPGDLPGIKWDRTRSMVFKTSIYEAVSGAERRLRHRPWPKYSVDLTYEVLRESRQFSELQQLLGFFGTKGGSYESFLFKDPHDCTASNLIFAVGDGVTKRFQLVRRIGDYAEPVHNPAANVVPTGSGFRSTASRSSGPSTTAGRRRPMWRRCLGASRYCRAE